MKRFVIAFAMALSFIATGCDMETVTSSDVTHVAETFTALAYTPTPMSTPHPSEGQIASLLNANLQALSTDPLSQSLNAALLVGNVDLPPNGANRLEMLQIHVRCECPRDGDCCNAEHTFVIVVQAMKLAPDFFIGLVPDSVEEVQVFCYDHGRLIGTLTVYWAILKDYLVNNGITGYQLGDAVRKSATPMP